METLGPILAIAGWLVIAYMSLSISYRCIKAIERNEPTEECCNCNKKVPLRKAVVITETPKDDRRLGITEGGTLMSATYCKKCGKNA